MVCCLYQICAKERAPDAIFKGDIVCREAIIKALLFFFFLSLYTLYNINTFDQLR